MNSTAQTSSPVPQRGSDEEITVTFWTDTTEGSTFESDKLRWWTERQLTDAERVLNPCAGQVELNTGGDTLRVDLNEDANANLHIDFRDLLDHVEESSFDAIVYDPPYTYHQAVKKYGIEIERDEFYYYDEEVKRLFNKLLKPGGLFIQFGYTTVTMPKELGYQTTELGIFNKLGCQNDYFGVAARKPKSALKAHPEWIYTEQSVKQNGQADKIDGGDITTDGNGGNEIATVYSQVESADYKTEMSKTVRQWVDTQDRVLHIYKDEKRVSNISENTVTHSYSVSDEELSLDTNADEKTKPWNIGSTYATGVFDVVILDLPYSAWQRNIETPYEQQSEGSDVTHEHTAIKRSISDLVKGNTGRVIQIGRTATAMSGEDYNYCREGIGVIQHPHKNTDRIISVDRKNHENLEIAGLGSGEVDRLFSHPYAVPDINDKNNRTDFTPLESSETSVYTGNSCTHHPAAYNHCPSCGARQGNMCNAENGGFKHPTGPYHTLAEEDLCDERIELYEERNNSSRNNKDHTTLTEKSEQEDMDKNRTDTSNLDDANILSFA